MLIQEWMTTEVCSVPADTSLMKAAKMMKDRRIRRLPVVDDQGRLIGIVTDRDIKEASPSKATTLDVHELYYLLSEIKVRDIMTKDPVALHANDTVEKAVVIMGEKRFGGMPVVDDSRRVVGIITYSDVFRVLIEITGVKYGGLHMALELPNHPGGLNAVLEDLGRHNVRIVSVLTSFKSPDAPTRRVYIRLLPSDPSTEETIVGELQKKYSLLYWAKEAPLAPDKPYA